MSLPNRLTRFLIAAGLVLLLPRATSTASGQGAPDIAVIVHPGVALEDVTRNELRRVLLGDREQWSPGLQVVIAIRAPISRERDAAVQDICQMTEKDFRQHWIAKVFRAAAPSGPKVVYSQQGVLDFVSHTPGAISFIEARVTDKGVKVLKVDGKLPGQDGYTLK